MNSLLLLLILILIGSHTYVSYITFLLCMIHLVIYIFLLGNYYLSLIYFMIYLGSIAILFIYILMVLSIISSHRQGYLVFILPFISISLLGLDLDIKMGNTFNLLDLSHLLYQGTLLIPLAILLFVAMIFAIRYL